LGAVMLRWILAFVLSVSVAQALDFSVLEQISIQEGGRKKPFLVFSEESLLGLSGKTALTVDGHTMSAPEVVTTLWLNPAGWETKPLILVNHKDLKKALGYDVTRKLFSYQELSTNLQLQRLIAEAQATSSRPGQKLAGLPKEASEVGGRLANFESLVNGSAYRFIANPAGASAAWFPAVGTTEALAPLREAFISQNSDAFRAESLKLQKTWAEISPQYQPPAWKIALEATYQRVHPFRWAWIFYATAGLLMIFLPQGRAGYTAGWIFAGAGFLCQVAGFTSRILIAGRPPVTNMYESILWVAFGTILFALVFEAIYRSRYFLLGAVPVAVVSLILADTQPLALNRSIEPLQAVLRDNFWLSTHVLTITLSYAAFALALGIGHIVLGTIIAGRKPSAALYSALYRAIQVGVLLVATGTILGGVWANYSWGRFWDWDPKETWALITLLSYLFVLHGRIAGKWGGFGLAVGSVLCFQCVVMAWYGVNFVLGVGLHSYGFGTGGLGWAIAFVAAELAFVALAVWRKKTNTASKSGASQPEVARAA
jgi:cytochrome c-type biogenesis protein CcsB